MNTDISLRGDRPGGVRRSRIKLIIMAYKWLVDLPANATPCGDAIRLNDRTDDGRQEEMIVSVRVYDAAGRIPYDDIC